MGRVGMHTAPARMMRSAHTVAKTGRKIKKSTNKVMPSFRERSANLPGPAHGNRSCAVPREEPVEMKRQSMFKGPRGDVGARWPLRSYLESCSGAHRLYGHVVHQELRAGNNDAVA